MGKGRSKNQARRSTGTLPRGIPHKKGGVAGSSNPFDFARTKNSASRVKHPVHNKLVPGSQRTSGGGGSSKLAESLARRQKHLSSQLANAGKANSFIDRRIGEATRTNNYDGPDVMLRRLVQERIRRSKKLTKFSLGDDNEDDDGEGWLTHRGSRIDESYTGAPIDHNDVILSDDDEEDLDRVDTMLHFGGGKFDSDNTRERGAYGNGGIGEGRDEGAAAAADDMGRAYRSRREELEDRIRMKKMAKVEKMQRKENQTETFETMDESFAELSKLLSFRDKEAERIHTREARAKGVLSLEEKEMDDWDKEMKTYLFERKVKATDRTKSPEEIAKAKADELHALESKRLARMAGDFLSDDEFSDVSDDEDGGKGGKKRKRRSGDKGKSMKSKKASKDYFNPEEMDDDDNDENEGQEFQLKRGVRFTADGLMYVDENDNVIGKVGEDDDNDEEEDEDEQSDEESNDDSSDEESVHHDLGGSDDEASAALADSDEEVDDNLSVSKDKAVEKSKMTEAEIEKKKKLKAKLRAK
jgi:nucleolar protein 14